MNNLDAFQSRVEADLAGRVAIVTGGKRGGCTTSVGR
jgi:hypothetical protein